MLIKAFQIVLVALVALFTVAGLTLLLSVAESTLIARQGVSSFAFAVSARAFRIFIISGLLLFAAAVLCFIRRQH